MLNKSVATALAAGLTASVALSTAHAAPTNEELYEIIKAQQSEIDDLKKNKSSTASKTTIGGYGELHYNNENDGAKEIDFHRFVLFFDHEFNDKIRLVTELELEHSLAGDGKPGEVELEQAYVEFDVAQNTWIRTGLFLVPVGHLNETHEPPTFYGVERNEVEKNIIPTTWWEAGVAVGGELAPGWNYQVAYHSGLKQSATNLYRFRSGRQKVAEADARYLATTARLGYNGVPGLDVSFAVNYQDDFSQSKTDNTKGALLLNANLVYNIDNVSVKALYAAWDLDGSAPKAADADSQKGGYLELGYKFTNQVGVFARQNEYEYYNGSLRDVSKLEVGVNYWPTANVVLKADAYTRDEDGADTEGFNLGVGYQF